MTTGIHPVRDFMSMTFEGDPDGDGVIDAEFEESEEEDVDQAPRWVAAKYPGIAKGYKVSDWGVVKTPRGKIVKPSIQGDKRWIAMRRTDGGSTTSARLDKLVLSSFVGFQLMTAGHKDGDQGNCRLDNLEWVEPTPTELKQILLADDRRKGKLPPYTRKATRKSKDATRVVPKSTTVAKRPEVDEIEVMRVYRSGALRIEVGLDGGISSLEPYKDLTVAQTTKLHEMLSRIVETNRLMGVK